MSPVLAEDDSTYKLHYLVEFLPAKDAAKVTLSIPDARLLRELDFNIHPEQYSNFKANGELSESEGRIQWTPPDENARLEWTAQISNKRSKGSFDALMTPDWAIFRGDDLVPAARVRSAAGAEAVATLEFKLPDGWPWVNTGWEDVSNRVFKIDNPERRFDRPIGWMIAGKLGTRRERLGNTRVSVSAPRGTALHRMDVLSFLTVVWPELEKAFGDGPPELLIVGGDDPMWRGGLSAPNSLFMHAERPLVSENGTSTLVHEIVHSVTRIRGARDHDWIAEGLAEYYAVELLYRAGALTEARRERVFDGLAEWSSEVDSLIKTNSKGKTTARAALLFKQLDSELQEHSDANLDIVVRQLMDSGKASLEDLRDITRELLGRDSSTLKSPLLGSA